MTTPVAVTYLGGVWGIQPTPQIPMISVESSIAWARKTGISISFCSSLCSHAVVIYEIKVSFNTNCLAVAYLVSEFKPNPTSRKFDKIEPDCKLSGKCLVFHSNILISFKIAEFRTPTPQDVRKKSSEILKLPPVHNCFTLTMTNKLVVIINSLKYQKLRKFYYMKWNFLYQIIAASRTPD